MDTLEQLTTDGNLAPWIPADFYADLILEATVCYGQLSGVITALDYDAAQGTGGVVQVRYVPARTAQGPMAACACLSATSSTVGTYSITIRPYGDYDEMCSYSLWKANGPVKDKILNEMAKGLAAARDTAIWTALITSTPGYSTKSTVSCLSTATDSGCCGGKFSKSLYNSIVSITQQMKDAAYNPDYLILNPTVAKTFYYKDYLYENGFQTRYDANGNMTMLHGLKVIESCAATSCANTSKATLAIIIDSSRAVGEAWGMRPKFEEERIAYCDKVRETIWMYWGTHALDLNAIGQVINP